MNRFRSIVMTAAAAALLAAPAVGQAHHKPTHSGGNDNGNGNSAGNRGGKCVVKKGFVVKGTLVSFTADDPATGADEESVTLTVTKMNRHARRSGLTDADPATEGTQYTVSGDAFRARLSGFEAGETPGAGDRVRVSGKVAVTKRRCEPGASVEDRYDEVNVRRVKIVEVG